MNRMTLVLGACVVAAAGAYAYLRPHSASTDDTANTAPTEGSAIVSIEMPPIEGNAAIGQRIFATTCATCHGENGVGVEGSGPPLIHEIYRPNHHADEAFQRAVATGVRSHHWPFGNMPPVEGMTRGDVAMVVAYIREIQRANGIQ